MQELKQLASQVREEEEAIADIDSQRREQRNRLDRIAKLSGVIDKLTSVLQETSKELEAKKAASKAVKALQERMDGQKDRYTEMEAQKKVCICAGGLLLLYCTSMSLSVFVVMFIAEY